MNHSNEQLIHIIDQSKATLQELSEALEERGDMQAAMRTLMTSDDLLIDFIKMAQKSPDVMRGSSMWRVGDGEYSGDVCG